MRSERNEKREMREMRILWLRQMSIDGTDRRKDGRTDTQPLHRPYTDYESGSVNLA